MIKYILVDENEEFQDSLDVELISDLPDQRMLVEDSKNGNTFIVSNKSIRSYDYYENG